MGVYYNKTELEKFKKNVWHYTYGRINNHEKVMKQFNMAVFEYGYFLVNVPKAKSAALFADLALINESDCFNDRIFLRKKILQALEETNIEY